MRISPITSVTVNQTRTTTNHSYPVKRSQITFGISEHERRIEEKVKEKTKDMSWVERNLLGGKSKARTSAEREVEKEDLARDKELLVQKTINEETKKRVADQMAFATKIEQLRQQDTARIAALEDAQRGHIQWQREMYESSQQTTRMISEQISSFANIMKEMQAMRSESERTTQELIKQLIEAKNTNNKSMEEELNRMKDELRKEFEQKYKIKAEEAEKTKHMDEMFRKMHETNAGKGFGKVGGYQKEKDVLITQIGNSIISEKSGQPTEIPNGILFYGPKGNGKSLFARAFAEQLGCHNVKIELDIDEATNLRNLKEAAKKAQENFEKDGTRTIIRIEEFDDFAPKNSRIVAPLKSFMDDVSQKYHATIFATTNFPENIDDILLRNGRFSVKVPLAPANKSNTTDIVKHYAEKFADATVNYEKIAEELVSVQPNEAYSNAKIETIIKGLISEITEKGKKTFSHTELLGKIKEFGADISKQALEKFADQIIYMRKI